MGNTIPNPLRLPDPTLFLPGRPLVDWPVLDMLGSLNHCIAEGHATHLFQQSWPDGNCAWTGDWTLACTWRIPIVSDAHTSIALRVRGSTTDPGNGRVRFMSTFGADASEEAMLAAGNESTWVVLDALAIADGGDGYDTVTMHLKAPVDKSVQVLHVWSETSPLTALPFEPVSGAIPFGLSRAPMADRPLPASRGRQIIDTLEALLARPRVIQCWSGLAHDAVNETMPLHGVATWAPRHFYADIVPRYTGSVLAIADADASEIERDTEGERVVIPSAVGAAWTSWTDTHHHTDDRIGSANGDIELIRTRIRSGDRASAPRVTSIAIWGP